MRDVGAGEDDFFQSISESAPDIVFAALADGSAAYFNEQWYRFTGRSSDDSLGLDYLSSVHAEDVARLSGAWRWLPESIDGRWSVEIRLRRYDGRYLWHRVSIAPLSGSRAREVPYVGSIADIDGARSVERAFRTLAETVQTLVWSAQPDGTVDYYNIRWSENVRDIAVLLRDGLESIVHPEDIKSNAALWNASIESGEAYASRLRLHVRSDEYRWYELTANAERDTHGAVVRWFGTATDVEENVELRDALRDKDATLELFREFARRTPSLLLTIGAEGRVDFINERWAEMLGVDIDTLLSADWREFVHENDLDEVARLAREHASSGEPYVGDWRVRRADGTYRWIEVRLNAQRDESGTIERWFGAALDIDSQRRALDALELIAESGRSFSRGETIGHLFTEIARASLAGITDVSLFDFSEDGKPPQRIVTGGPEFADDVAVMNSFDVAVDEVSTPIARAITERRSILIESVDDAFIEANVSPKRRRDAWRSIEIRSMLVVPLVVNDKSFGSLSLVRLHGGAKFNAQDLRVIEDIARRTSVAIENILLREEARQLVLRREERFHRIADAIPQLMWVALDDGAVEWVNERWLEFTGFSSSEAIEAGWIALVHPEDRREALANWNDAVVCEGPFENEYRLRGKRWNVSLFSRTRDVGRNGGRTPLVRHQYRYRRGASRSAYARSLRARRRGALRIARACSARSMPSCKSSCPTLRTGPSSRSRMNRAISLRAPSITPIPRRVKNSGV